MVLVEQSRGKKTSASNIESIKSKDKVNIKEREPERDEKRDRRRSVTSLEPPSRRSPNLALSLPNESSPSATLSPDPSPTEDTFYSSVQVSPTLSPSIYPAHASSTPPHSPNLRRSQQTADEDGLLPPLASKMGGGGCPVMHGAMVSSGGGGCPVVHRSGSRARSASAGDPPSLQSIPSHFFISLHITQLHASSLFHSFFRRCSSLHSTFVNFHCSYTKW